MEINFNFPPPNLPPNHALGTQFDFLPEGGFRITVPPGQGFGVLVRLAGGVAAPVAGVAAPAAPVVGGPPAAPAQPNALPGVGAGFNLTPQTQAILNYAETNFLSQSQVYHLLNVDESLPITEHLVTRPTRGVFAYPIGRVRLGDGYKYFHQRPKKPVNLVIDEQLIPVKYRRSFADLPNNRVMVTNRYYMPGDDAQKFIMHYQIHGGHPIETDPLIPLDP